MIFLLVKNKMIQIGASLRVVGIPLKWHVSQTGQSAKKVSKAIFRENASKVKTVCLLSQFQETQE